MGNINNNQPVTKIIANDVYVVKDGDTAWGGEVNRNFEILSELNRRAKLYVTYGDVEEDTMPVKQWSYSIDGNDVIIQLPKQSVPKVDHFKLTIKMDNNTLGVFDNTQDETINIYSPNYAELVFKQNGTILQSYRPDGNSVDITIPEVTNHRLTVKQGNQTLGTFDNSQDTTINIPQVVVNNNTLTISQNGQILGTFDNSSNTTINIPSAPQAPVKTLTLTQDGQTLGVFNTDTNNTIDIPAPTNKTLTITQNGVTLGTFNNSNNVSINIPTPKNTLTLTQDGVTLGTFDTDTDNTIDIPKATYNNKTLTIMQGGQILGTFDNSSNATIIIPANTSTGQVTVPKTLTITQDGQTLGNFITDTDATIDIPSYPDGTLDITVNGDPVGTFNIKSDATIDIPVHSFNGASHTIERYNGLVDGNGDKQFDILQTLNTASAESIKTYDLVLDIDGNLVNYNPFVDDDYNIFINTGSNPYGSSNDYNEIANYITFAPYPRNRDQVFYIKDYMGNANSDNMVIELPVHFVDIWDGIPKDAQGNSNPNANHLGHFHTYGQDGNDVVLNMSPYMKVSDVDTTVSGLGYIKESDADAKYVKINDISNYIGSGSGSGNTPQNLYNLTIDVDGTTTVYNPATPGTYSVSINTGGAFSSSDVSESITFSPYPKNYDETFYIKDITNNPKTNSMTIDLPVHYVDIWDGIPKDAQGNAVPTTNLLSHFSTYGADGTDIILNLSAYMKVSDMPTKLSQFANDEGYTKPADVSLMLAALDIPENLTDLNNDMNVSDFANDAGYITEADADNKYLAITDAEATYIKDSDVSESITFSPYPPDANDPVYYLKETANNPKSDTMTIELPVRYVNIWNDNPLDAQGVQNPNAKLLCHFHTYGEDGNDMVLDLSDYMKISDMPTKLSQFTNDGVFITETDADSKYLSITDASTTYAKISDVPTDVAQLTNSLEYATKAEVNTMISTSLPSNLTDLNNDMSVSDFTNDAGYITETAADSKYLKITDFYDTGAGSSSGSGTGQQVSGDDYITKAFADGRYLTLSIADSRYLSAADVPTTVSQLANDSDYITKAFADGKYMTLIAADGRYAKISSIPSKLSDLFNDMSVSEFDNDAGYVTETDADNKYLTITDAGTTYAKISDVPTNVSQLANDSQYISEPDADNKYLTIADASITYAPISSVPATVSQLANDSLYISEPDADNKYLAITTANTTYAKISDVPTAVSQLTNDSDYVKKADADLTYIPLSEKGVPNGVAMLNADGHLVLPSGIEIW